MTNDTPIDSVGSPPRHVISSLLAAIPGVLLGAYITGLLFFINPELDPTPLALARGVAFYGSLFGAVSMLVTWLLAGLRRAAQLLPWSLTVVLTVATLSTWAHAYRYAYYLPPGINVRLVKAAVTLSLLALVAFVTALLHTLERRPYGIRSRLLLTVLGIALLVVMIERRAAFDPPPPPAPLDSITAYSSRPELWVIGLDGATLDAVLPLVEQGQLPFFEQLLERGVAARIESFPAALDGPLWTTLATGHHPYRHRVVSDRVYPAAPLAGADGELRLVPAGYRWWGFYGSRWRPIDADHRRHLTLWEILSRLDIDAGVVGWPAAYPARGTLSYAFSARYFDGDPTMADARPSELARRGLLFRVPPADIPRDQTAVLGETPPFPLVRALADDLWRESLIRFLLEQRPEVDAMFLRLDGLARASADYFGAFARVQFEGAQDPSHQLGARRLAGYYHHLDRFLAALAGGDGDRLLVIVSPYGYQPPTGWRRLTRLAGDAALAGTRAGAPDGLLLIDGPGIANGVRLADAQAVDVLPTILHALGLPIARDLDGRVLTSVFERGFLARRPLTFVPSYETLSLEADPLPGPELLELAVPVGR